jgi:23S rRNA pseudouridine1911/1915/1917 synthase
MAPSTSIPNKESSRQVQLPVKEASRLLKFLHSQFPNKSRTTIKSFLAHRQVAVDHHTVSHYNYPLVPGQIVTVTFGIIPEETRHRGLRILFEDPYMIVIEKEAGMLSIATSKEKMLTAYSILSDHVKKENPANRIFVIHRLDRDTSGVMIFAKSEEVQSIFQREWQDIVIERTYIAVVEGDVIKDERTIRSYLKENKALVMYSTSNPEEGVVAITHYKVLMRSAEYSLLEIRLETGRKNQIRIHMKDMGHPVAGDKKYGSRQNPIGRTALHARVLSFIHPVTHHEVRYETAIPKRFLSLFKEKVTE